MFESKIKEMVLASLVADAYCLGSHWIYDEEQLRAININWEQLNNACSIWHKGKIAGEFTHYGDQTYWLYEYLTSHDGFDLEAYMKYWANKMEVYDGYIDSATRDTLENLKAGQSVPCGSTSYDFSIVSRIVPLLMICENKEAFVNESVAFVKATHDNPTIIEATQFFALLLVEVLLGKDITQSINSLKEKFSYTIQNWIEEGLLSKNEITFDAIRRFGPACSVEGAFAGVIHLLVKYDNFKEAMIANAQAGGDNSARAMMVAAILVAKYGLNKIPQEWTKLKYTI